MEKVACYCRVSTKKTEQELSLENQQKVFCEYAEKYNFQIYRIYKDDGISAKSMKKRDEFNRMVSDAKKGLFEKILVKDISRFARNTYDFLGVIRELRAMGVEVKFLTADMSTLDSELTLTILAAVAQEESANLSKRVKFAKKQSAKEGRVPSSVYGYDKVDRDRFNLTINRKEARVVQRIFELYVDQQMSSYGIARLLNEECVPTKRGGKYKWSQTVVCNILKNRLYIGEVCNGKSEVTDFITDTRVEYAESEWIVTQRPDFRIISDELFQKANEIRGSRSNSYHQFEENGKIKRKRPSVKYTLSNLLVCANDNYSFRRRVREYEPSGYSYTYWTCSKRDYGVDTCNNSIKVDENQMHRAITAFLLGLFRNQDILRKRFRDCVSNELNRRFESEFRLSDLLAEEKSLTAQRDKLMDLYLSNIMSKEAIAVKVAPIEKRLDQLQKIIKVSQSQDSVSVDIERALAKLIESIDYNLDNLLDNAFLKSIFQKFIVYPDGKVVAVIHLDMDTGEVMEIPFGQFVDEKEVSVPKCTADI